MACGKQFNYFKERFFVICYDTRGHGSSSAPQGPYTLPQLAEDVIRLLDHLNIEKASFCGISMGGLTGQWLAIHYPQRFNAVVISNTCKQQKLTRTSMARSCSTSPRTRFNQHRSNRCITLVYRSLYPKSSCNCQ